MNKFLVVLGALVAGALLIPDVAEAQRGGRGGGGARMGGGGFGGGGASRGGGASGVADSVVAPGCTFRGAA
ncbi:hypothetical protein ACD578_06395 [Microvirga sp. RSM25]|uniref:hypothetical protein n=1 Tax=Microvirga sp. RSM25 TaxID=3273802 RepID=UPI00384C63FA